jgi:cystathionine beta-lyase/cystathionine gamma-synthase
MKLRLGGTHEAIRDILTKFHVECDFVDGTDVSAYEKAIKKNTKVLYGETPANPTMSIVDLEALANLGKKHNIITMVDSTFASPYNQNPLKHGIDIVIHSGNEFSSKFPQYFSHKIPGRTL